MLVVLSARPGAGGRQHSVQHTKMAAIGRAKGERTVGDGRKGEGRGERKKRKGREGVKKTVEGDREGGR